ncbi:hypothetical protein [Pseudidiomarina sp.]|uniref:hypothetical protein n=1 Tax=Pseudidiomarina sp. TaxID=2081707 RepID=UPI003A9748F2
MKNIIYITAFIGSFIVLQLSTVIAQEHEHDGQTHKLELELNQGKRWTIDESLHIGMTSLKREIEINLEAIHNNQFSAVQYQELAGSLNDHLNFLFKNCKLEPKADAQLHILLARIMNGVEQIKSDDNQKQGVVLIIQSLQEYPVYFEDSNWQSLKH